MESIGEDGTLSLDQTRTLAQVSQGYTYFRDGDVIVAKITPCFENGKGALCRGLVSGIGFGTTELHVLRPRIGLSSRFLSYLTRSQPFRSTGIALMYGAAGQKRVPEDFIRDFKPGIPPIDEQEAIVAFLDRETTAIDALIEKKERLIALLLEKWAALISRTVTRGLDLAASMTDSGVPSVGSIPSHWQIKQVARLVPDSRPVMYGIVLPGPNVDDGVPIVKGGDVAPGRLRLDLLNRTTREIESGYARSRLRAGDIVYAIRGSIGMAEIVPPEIEGANLTQDAARISPRVDVNRKWLLYALKSKPVFAQLDARATGATIRGINIRDLKRAWIPVPPCEEQESIASFLETETAKLDRLTSRVREHIDKLREYRAALISAAVTGKIDVRAERA
jgi:type I restriction enzyme S subunit